VSDDRPDRPEPLNVDPSGVPEYLRERPLWLVWKYEWKADREEWSKVPKDGAGGGYNINATDPANGVAFETAAETYQAGDYDGLGIITDADSLLVGFDVDDCRDPDRPHASVPDVVSELVDTLDTYVEVSPSGTGYRAFALGAKPEGPNREDLPCDPVLEDTPHLEVYDGTGGRYLTVTGQHLSGTPEGIETRPQQIKEVYGEFVDTDDETADLEDFDDDRPDDGPELDLTDEELLERARSASNGGKFERLENGYDGFHGGDTSKADKAFCQMLAFWTGGDRAAIDRLFQNSDRMRGKWTDVHSSDGDTYGEMTIDAALKDQTEFYDPTGGSDGDTAPDPAELDWNQVERAEAILQTATAPEEPAGELEYQNGVYGYSWVKRDDNGDVIDSGFDTVCNFTIETLAILDTYEGDLMYIRVHPEHPREEPYEVKVKPTVFNDARSFREEIVTGRTTYFDPGTHPIHKALRELRQTVGSQDAPMHTGTEYVGLHGNGYDEWVTPAGTLTADGWVDDPEYKYYEKGGADDMESSIQEKWDLTPERNDEFDTAEVREIVERVGWMRKPERGLSVLGWFYAAPLKPVIHDLEREFNLLQVTGGTGTGKTSTLQTLYQLFGAAPAPSGCGDKAFTIEKKLSSSCGLPIWLDEYKPADLPGGKLKWLHRRLREVTREQSFSKGTPDLGEITFQMRAPVVFSGEQTVEEAAVRRRAVMTNFSKESTNGRYQRAYCELTGATYTDDGEERTPNGYALDDHALAYYQWVLKQSVNDLESKWKNAREKAQSIVRTIDASGLENTELQGLQTIVFGYNLFREFAESVGADLSELPSETDLAAALEHVAMNIGPGGRRREHIDEFTELVAQAATEEYIEAGTHYRVLESRKYETEVLAFHMPSTFTAVKRFIRDYNIESEYTILGKNDYLDNFGDKIEQGSSYPLATSKKVRDLENGSKGVYIDLERADELVDGFNRSAFVDDTDETSDVDAPAGVTPVTDLENGEMASLTVELVQLYTNKKDWYAEEGWLVDSTDAVKLIVRDDLNTDLEAGTAYRIDNASVHTDDDGIQSIEPIPGMTSIKPIDKGDGLTEEGGFDWLPSVDGSDSEPPALEDTEQSGLEETATDGGDVPDDVPVGNADDDRDGRTGHTADGPPADAQGPLADAQRLAGILTQRGRLTRGVLLQEATDTYDMELDTAKGALEKALREGIISGVGGDRLESV